MTSRRAQTIRRTRADLFLLRRAVARLLGVVERQLTASRGRQISLKQAMRLTGLKRRELLYFEDEGFIGAVARVKGGRRVYQPEQVRRIELIELMRKQLKISRVEASRLAREIEGETSDVSTEHITRMRRQVLTGTAKAFGLLVELDDLIERRIAGSVSVSAPASP